MAIIEIWMEGFAVTGQRQGAHKIGEDEAEDFDQAIEIHKGENPDDHGISTNERSRYTSDKAYENRKSNYNIWACNLFDNEEDARKSLG